MKWLSRIAIVVVLLGADGLQLGGSMQALADPERGGSFGAGRQSDSLDGTPVDSPDFHRLNEIPGMLVEGAYHAVMGLFGGSSDAAPAHSGDSYGGENQSGPAGSDGNPRSGNA